MFLSNTTLGNVVINQVKFKLKAYMGAILSLVFAQIIGIIFSMNGTSTMGSGVNNIQVEVTTITLDALFVLVNIWALIVGNLLTTKAYRYDDFSFVATRLSSNIANIIFLCIVSTFAGITTFFANYILRSIYFLSGKSEYINSPGFLDDPLGSLLTIVVVTIVILVMTAGGYLAGLLIQNSKIFIFLIPVFYLSIIVTKTGQSFLQLFFENESIMYLIVKLICVIISFFTVAILCSNRLEVRP